MPDADFPEQLPSGSQNDGPAHGVGGRPPTPEPDRGTASTADPNAPDDAYASDRQRAGWGPSGEPARDRRTDERRQAERREELRRADDRYAPDGTLRAWAEPPSLRVPTPAVSSGTADASAGAGRLLAVLLLIIVAFSGGVAIDQAAWRGTAAGTPVITPAPGSGVARPPVTAQPGASGAPASGSGAPEASGGSPVATPGPTIGPGATVPPFAPANVGLVWDALQLIGEHWVRRSDLNPTDLTYGALNGLIDSLGDPGHTVFLTPAEVKSENDALSGQITGIGVFLGLQGGLPFVQSVVSGSPAARAGVLPGDSIIAIDGTSAENLSIEEVARLVRGPVGSQVTITVVHAHGNAPVDISITRATITVPAVTWAMLPGTTFADIRIAEFSSGTTDQFVTAVRGARQAGAKGIVLDLRNNPGGFVDDAVGVASQLLPGGTVYVRKTSDGTQIPVPVKSGGIATDIPLVVLVDYGSASSAEITAGALQDAKRGPVVGTRTYGTGTVLNTFDLPDGSALRLGVEEWLTPSGRAIFPNGIQPDQEVDLVGDTQPLEPDALRAMTTADLQASGDLQLLRAITDLTSK